MSVDVFGRQLVLSQSSGRIVGSRGPPGEGFKTTLDGQYDIDHRRLSNLAEPILDSDAVTLKILKDTVSQERRLIYATITGLRQDIDSASTIIQSLDAKLQSHIKERIIEKDTVYEQVVQLSSHNHEIQRKLESLQDTIQQEIDVIVRGVQEQLMNHLKELEKGVDTNQDLSIQNSTAIAQLNARLINLEQNG